MSLPSATKQIILSCVVKHLSKTEYKVLLFGSYAKNRSKETSDIDIAIKSSTPLDLATWAAIEGDIEESEIPQPVDVIDYLRVSKEFQDLIDTEGVVL